MVSINMYIPDLSSVSVNTERDWSCRRQNTWRHPHPGVFMVVRMKDEEKQSPWLIRLHVEALWMLSHFRALSLRSLSLSHPNSDVMGVEIPTSALLHSWVRWISVNLQWCPLVVVFFFSFSFETVWRQTADLFFCGEFRSRLGTGIRSTQKPQRHVSPTHTHTHT